LDQWNTATIPGLMTMTMTMTMTTIMDMILGPRTVVAMRTGPATRMESPPRVSIPEWPSRWR
jgi:hypothetical protein